MRLVPIAEEGAAAGTPAPGDAAVPGMGTVESSAEGIRLAGVRTAVATRDRLAAATRTVGAVVADEGRVHRVQTKIGGWVERLHVDATGAYVRAGQPILALYSPELLASQEELLRAREAAARFAGSSLPEVRRGGEELVAAARRRLELYDVPASFIATVERTGKPQRAVTMVAPASGFVTAKSVFAGQEVQPGMELFTLTDLSQVWVEADFYEYEARLLRVGQQLEVRLPYAPDAVLRAAIALVYPTLQPESRTVKVRLELPNPDGQLRPGMYVDVVAHLEGAEGVVVPDDAVLESGVRQVVFVETEPGAFAPREVRVGMRGDGKALLVAGLAAGETVATRANFLLDSESRLRAALAGMGGGAPAAPVVGLPAGREPASAAAEPSPHAGHQH
jgi:RND family efflux transporter MFP subunit